MIPDIRIYDISYIYIRHNLNKNYLQVITMALKVYEAVIAVISENKNTPNRYEIGKTNIFFLSIQNLSIS